MRMADAMSVSLVMEQRLRPRGEDDIFHHWSWIFNTNLNDVLEITEQILHNIGYCGKNYASTKNNFYRRILVPHNVPHHRLRERNGELRLFMTVSALFTAMSYCRTNLQKNVTLQTLYREQHAQLQSAIDNNNINRVEVADMQGVICNNVFVPETIITPFDPRTLGKYEASIKRIEEIVKYVGRGVETALRTNDENSAARHETLLEELRTLREQNEELKSSHNKLLSQNEQLKTQQDIVLSQNEDLKTSQNNLLSQIEELKTHQENLISQNEVLKTNQKKLNSNVEKLITQNEELKDIIQSHHLQNRIADRPDDRKRRHALVLFHIVFNPMDLLKYDVDDTDAAVVPKRPRRSCTARTPLTSSQRELANSLLPKTILYFSRTEYCRIETVHRMLHLRTSDSYNLVEFLFGKNEPDSVMDSDDLLTLLLQPKAWRVFKSKVYDEANSINSFESFHSKVLSKIVTTDTNEDDVDAASTSATAKTTLYYHMFLDKFSVWRSGELSNYVFMGGSMTAKDFIAAYESYAGGRSTADLIVTMRSWQVGDDEETTQRKLAKARDVAARRREFLYGSTK